MMVPSMTDLKSRLNLNLILVRCRRCLRAARSGRHTARAACAPYCPGGAGGAGGPGAAAEGVRRARVGRAAEDWAGVAGAMPPKKGKMKKKGGAPKYDASVGEVVWAKFPGAAAAARPRANAGGRGERGHGAECWAHPLARRRMRGGLKGRGVVRCRVAGACAVRESACDRDRAYGYALKRRARCTPLCAR